jgi:5-methylcytosine-specific restriction endonuclease McrA
LRFLDRPNIDDSERLRQVCSSPRLHAAPVIRPLRALVENRYGSYIALRGDPWRVAEDNAFQPPRDSFHEVYRRPPKSLKFIAEIRDQTFGACPVCGSGATGSIDHYLPKATYPEFSFLSYNLVPACHRCNGKKGTTCKGDAQGERAIHPYFDAAAADRLMIAILEPPIQAPLFRAVPFNPPPGLAGAIAWHIANIVLPSGFSGHCQQRWSGLVTNPKLFLGETATDDSVREQLEKNAERSFVLSQSHNGWDGCFFSGVAASDIAVEHLTQLLNLQLENSN